MTISYGGKTKTVSVDNPKGYPTHTETVPTDGLTNLTDLNYMAHIEHVRDQLGKLGYPSCSFSQVHPEGQDRPTVLVTFVVPPGVGVPDELYIDGPKAFEGRSGFLYKPHIDADDLLEQLCAEGDSAE